MDRMRALNVVFFTAVAVSVVHYTDNTLNFDSFPQGGSGPEVTRDTIWIAWIVLTAFGVAGYLSYRAGQIRRGAVLLAAYSLSGLVGIGHYAEPGAGDMAWYRHLHVAVDIACGLAVLAFSIWSVRQDRRPEATA